MSTHRSHHRKPISSKDSNNNNNGSFNFGNIAQMLSNIDVNQVSSLLGKINNTERQTNDGEQVNQNDYSKGANSINTFNEASSQKNTSREEIIKSINILVNSDKSELLRIVMEIYGANKTK